MPDLKPATADGYDQERTLACERTLVTLVRGFGTLKHTLRLVGGLVPRYLTPARPPEVPDHAGTSDVDLVLNIQVLAEGEAYKTLAAQLKARGFSRVVNDKGIVASWRWQRKVDHEYVVVEFLRDAGEELEGGDVATIDGEKISALAIKHAGIVHEWYEKKDITVDLLDDAGKATETVYYADAIAFIVLKALAFDDRAENKDAADLVHVMQYAADLPVLAETVQKRRAEGKYAEALDEALTALERRFCDGNGVEGFERDGPVACGRFRHGPSADLQDLRILEQRNASALVAEFLRLVRS